MTLLQSDTITEGSLENIRLPYETMITTGDCVEVKLFGHFPALCWVYVCVTDGER